MRLGLFDFGKKREEDPAASQDSVSAAVDPEAFWNEDTVSAEDIGDLWDSLAAELDELSLDDLEEQLSHAPQIDQELEEWADASDTEALKALVDAFVAETRAEVSPPEWKPLSEAPEVPVEPGSAEPPSRVGRGKEAMFKAADLLSELMEEDQDGQFGDTWSVEADRHSTDRAASILKSFHAEESAAADPETEPDPEAEHPASGVVSDEVVLALMHRGVIRVAQVYEASRYRRAGEPLWRAMLSVEDVDRGQLLKEVARQANYPVVDATEGLPVRSLVDNMRETLPADHLEGILLAGAVPVRIGIDAETLGYKLVLGADDPASEELARACAVLDMDTECQFLATDALTIYLDEVWPDRPPRAVRPALDFEDDGLELPDNPNLRMDRSPLEGDHGDQAENRPWPSANDGDDASNLQAESDPRPHAPHAAQDMDLLDRRAKKDRVVAALFKEGSISIEHVEKALQAFGQEGGKEAIWRLLAQVPGVDRDRIFSMAAKVYAFSRVEIGPHQPDHEFVMLIMETIAEARREELLRLNLLPYEYAIDAETGGARLIFVTHDPARSEVHRLLSQLKVGRFELRYADESALTKVVTEIFPRRNEYLDRMTGNESTFDLGTEYQAEESDLVDEGALEAEMSRSTLINLFEASLVESVRQGASDIHVFPNPKRHIEILFRVDGRLKRWHVDEKISAEAFLAVVKDNSTNIDRFERDMAQDGFIQRRIDDILIRFRVSVLPIATANQEIRAESVVIRVLDDRKVLTDLSKLGMLESAMERVRHAISQPHGMIILTGPTGSGKSTTLVAALHQVITPEVNVLTIEDPVEYIINGVRQIKLGHKLGLEDAIRAVLRHDPDIVMVGEMRDKPTADLAIKLANTGHLTFSTLHTNDAPSAVSRLYKMGVEPFLLAYAINLIVAQRLIRQLCPTCKKESTQRDPVLMERLGFSEEDIKNLPVYEPGKREKCPTCNGAGFKGRRAISETLYFSQEIRHLVAESGEDIDEEAIKKQAVKEGMLTLQDCARELVRQGVTSVDEMMRVTASE